MLFLLECSSTTGGEGWSHADLAAFGRSRAGVFPQRAGEAGELALG
jgi:hypothetical protein